MAVALVVAAVLREGGHDVLLLVIGAAAVAVIAAGLVLFVLTFAVNAVARVVIERRKAFTE